jgi:hypothetical protein
MRREHNWHVADEMPQLIGRTIMTRFIAARWLVVSLIALSLLPNPAGGDELTDGFASPPFSARPWVYWFWINGSISKEGITADLESLKRAGVGGVLWMEVSGPWWAPDGKVAALSPQWHEAMQWAISECKRLGLTFDMTLDFGYGSGGPHISPDLSMQRIVFSETKVPGGKAVDLVLDRPHVDKKVSAWLRPGLSIPPDVLREIEQSDSYRDVAALAVPLPASAGAAAYRIADLDRKSGLSGSRPDPAGAGKKPPAGAVTPAASVIDLTGMMDRDGRLKWDAPAGDWLVLRMGHASNYKMTRPSPQAAVGLECDRLSRAGVEKHFDAFLGKIISGARDAAGGTLGFAHIDSWEAGCQNWTASMPEEFRARRGYDIRPWLPVLTGRVVGSAKLSDRFLWDLRTTAGEMIRDNYAGRLRQLLQPHGMKLSIEAYGNLCIDDLSYAGASDMPISEFWAMGDGRFPTSPAGHYERSSKAMASAAHVYGKPVVGAESFTSGRGWRDHPFLLKAMGDRFLCDGVNRMIFHLSAHQAYANAIPGLTHRRWGEQFNRYNTWWEYSRPWIDYISRCQYMLQQGRFVADVCVCAGEGAPLNVNAMTPDVPKGCDYDLCSGEAVLRMTVRDGLLTLPSGMSYRYLVLPDDDSMTLAMARKVKELADAGAWLVGGKRPKGSPGLTDYQRADAEIEEIAKAVWDAGKVMSGKSLAEIFGADGLAPDFEGEDLCYIHRRVGEADVYFVANQKNQSRDVDCTFRVSGKAPQLWDPETGAIRKLPQFLAKDGRVTVPLHFEPMRSWFVVFRGSGEAEAHAGGKNFAPCRTLRELAGAWQVTFDPNWGGPKEPVAFDELTDWSRHADPRIHYYSGRAAYRKAFEVGQSEAPADGGRLLLDLGEVEVMARVKVNGKECGIAWKPPYRIDITRAARPGTNELEIDAVNLWINRMIGDEQLPEDSKWKDFETLVEWPEWFKAHLPRPSGRYSFTTCKHYKKDSPLVPSGLLGPVKLLRQAP